MQMTLVNITGGMAFAAGGFVLSIGSLDVIENAPDIISRIESKYRPVWVDAKVTDAKNLPGKIQILAVGNKVRDCKFVSASFYTIQKGVAMEAAARNISDSNKGNSRPLGVHYFNWVEIDTQDMPNFDAVQWTLEHDCGFWNVRTNLGPFKVTKG